MPSMLADLAIPVQRKVSGLHGILVTHLTKVALGESDDTNRSRDTLKRDETIEILDPSEEKLHNEDSGIGIMPWDGGIVVGRVTGMFKVRPTLSITILINQASEIHLANPKGSMIITLLLLFSSVTRQTPKGNFIPSSDDSGSSGALGNVSANTVCGTHGSSSENAKCTFDTTCAEAIVGFRSQHVLRLASDCVNGHNKL